MPLYALPLFPDGSSASPGIAFSAQPSCGFFRPASGTIGVDGGFIRFVGATGEIRLVAGQLAWHTSNTFATKNVAICPAAAGTPRVEVNNGTLLTYRDLIARQLFAGGDSTAGIASSTSLTNGTDTTVTNDYVVRGGQAGGTVNTGWLKIYVGTAVAWIPHWTNATP